MAENRGQGEQHDPIYEHIQRVVDEQLFSLVFQPVLSARKGWVKGYEFFTRFKINPQLAPDQWFWEAARLGLRKTLELTVIERALVNLRDIPEGIYLSINISPETVLGGELRSLLLKTPLHRLVLEISQRAEVIDYDALAMELDLLRERGLRLAVDNVDGGYSNFRHIRMLKPEFIKLDQRITHYVDVDGSARTLAAALVRNARALGITVVAEGIETQAQLEAVRGMAVDQVQGYLLGRPVAIDVLPE